jgi:hypothetical protein
MIALTSGQTYAGKRFRLGAAEGGFAQSTDDAAGPWASGIE